LSSGILWGASQTFYAPITFKAALSMGIGLECTVTMATAIALLVHSIASSAVNTLRTAIDGSSI